MNRQHEVWWWRKFANHGNELGYQVADEAESIARFIESLEVTGKYALYTNNFDKYVEGLVRGFQTTYAVEGGVSISTLYDLHYVRFEGMGLSDFVWWLKNYTNWKDRINYAYFESKVLAKG